MDLSGLHGLSCSRSAGRFARHSMLNQIIKESFGSIHIPSVLGYVEPMQKDRMA